MRRLKSTLALRSAILGAALTACDMLPPPGYAVTPANDPRNAEMKANARQPDGYSEPIRDIQALSGGEKMMKHCGFITRVLPRPGEPEHGGRITVWDAERAEVRAKLAAGQLPRDRYYAMIVKGEYVSVAASQADDFADNIDASEVCFWVDEIATIEKPAMNKPPVLHLPLAKWDGVLKHKMPAPVAPAVVPAASTTPASAPSAAAPIR